MIFKIAICTLNQWALDFEGNTQRIIKSIDEAVEAGAIYRAGPELEISGYSLEDAFFEEDTIDHCWDCLAKIIEHTRSIDIVLDIGMPVRNDITTLLSSKPIYTIYNCRVILYKGNVLCIRAKTRLAGEGNYREPRFFKRWPDDVGVVPFKLPKSVNFSDKGDVFVPLGADFVLELVDQNGNALKLGWEICQELWETDKASASLYHNFGCHLVLNGSGSYWELRKLNTVHDMIETVSRKAGACYAYSNLVGCDGQRYVFFGRSCIFDRGQLVAQVGDPEDIFEDVHMITYSVNPNEIDNYRNQQGIAFGKTTSSHWDLLTELPSNKYPSQLEGFSGIFRMKLSKIVENVLPSQIKIPSSKSIDFFQEEIYYYVSLWLWDYLRRSKMKGFMLPLSGGLDSSTVAVLVYCMCNLLFKQLDREKVQNYFRDSHGIQSKDLKSVLVSPAAICGLLLKCRYLATQYSGRDTEERARLLASSIGANFAVVSIQDIYSQCKALKEAPKPVSSNSSTLLDQNVQARLRMVVTYYLSEGNRIVLASGNVDEAIMGYLTKYDCSSADINPIGGLCKRDLESFIYFARSRFSQSKELVDVLEKIVKAPPSAELTGSEQRDEDDMGITYDEISVLGRVRRGIYGNCGPKGAFITVWKRRNEEPFKTKLRCFRDGRGQEAGLVAANLGDLVKRFYRRYANNRHKLTILTPALHTETYSPDDNRFDHRQFLYPSLQFQFKFIDEIIERIDKFGDVSL